MLCWRVGAIDPFVEVGASRTEAFELVVLPDVVSKKCVTIDFDRESCDGTGEGFKALVMLSSAVDEFTSWVEELMLLDGLVAKVAAEAKIMLAPSFIS